MIFIFGHVIFFVGKKEKKKSPNPNGLDHWIVIKKIEFGWKP